MKVREGKIPEGKGIFIYIIAKSWTGSMSSLADYLAENGYTWVAPKMQDGSIEFNADYQQALLAELAPELKRVGIDLVGWGFVYGETSPYRKIMNWCDKEIAITIKMISKFKPVAWIVDAEGHYENMGASGSDSAKKYMDGIKYEMEFTNDAIPSIPIGFSSFKFPESHDLPWIEFLSRSDFAAPQVYWWGDYRPDGSVQQLDKSIDQYKNVGAENLPFIPAGTFRDDDGAWWATAEQIERFNDACFENDQVIAMNYWDLKFLQQRDAIENALNDFVWDVDTETPEPPTECSCEAIFAEFAKILSVLKDIEKNIASHHIDVMAKLEGSGTTPPPAGSDYFEKAVTTEKNRIYLSWYKKANGQGAPEFIFYPSDGAPVAERIFVAPGTVLRLKTGSKTKGDGSGNYAWELAMDQPIKLMAGSAPVPNNVQLYVMEKFL